MDILIVRFSSLGDIVLTSGIIKYVKETLGDNVNMDFFTMSHFAGVFSDFPYIRNIYCINKGAGIKELNDAVRLMPEYDAVIDLHDNTRSFLTRLIFSCKSYVYDKNSFERRMFVRFRLFGGKLDKHTVEKYYAPFRYLLNLPLEARETLRPFLPCNNNNKAQSIKRVVIHPFASKRTKEWPFFADLAECLLDDGLEVCFIGEGDMDIPNGAINKIGRTSMQALVSNIASGDLLISTDSGPMHIGCALNIPVIAIFGPTTKELGFYPDFSGVKVLENKGLKCRPCHIHGGERCPKKHFKCMLDIGCEEVRYHANRILKNTEEEDN
ncbi:MAG: glycosyltransferase family 9 protein [Mucispirillum sp.]|nr:glycosyltransferase family 9 protein [Mucispirillum sp.]